MILLAVSVASALYYVSSVVASSAASTTSSPIVNLGYAQYQGAYDSTTNVTSFKSIRYAAPPVGNLRFAAPQPPQNEAGIQQATTEPDMCYQAGYGNSETAPVSIFGFNKRATNTPGTSEDCLYLNVYVPGGMPAEPTTAGGLPVVFWIHGGGYDSGYAALYNGTDLIQESHYGVIVVVTQYRLGLLGFLAGNEMKAGGALNAGVLDQRYAMQWVQKNASIATFGGDPSRVTIWGQSAGAGAVLQHIVADGGNTQPPLFANAITSSTFLPSQYQYNDRVPQFYYDQVISQAGCNSTADTLACLRAVNVSTLATINSYLAGTAFYGSYIWAPVVDGTFIVERPTVTLANGKVNGNMFLAFGNTDEGADFTNPNETLTITDYVSQLYPDMTELQTQEAAYMYQDMGSPLEQAISVMGDSIFVCPTYYLLQAFSGRSFKGIFAVPPGLHGEDVAYYFDNVPPPYNNTQFLTAFTQTFMAFAMYSNVNIKYDPTNITPYWDEYFIGQTEMLFNRTDAYVPVVQPVTTDPALVARCSFWRSVSAMTAQ